MWGAVLCETVVWGAVVWGGAACSPAPGPALRVAAAASLRELVTDGEASFRAECDLPLVVSFGASSALSRLIDAGAAFDVFLSADRENVERIAQHLVDGTQVVFLRNRLVVVGGPGHDDLPTSVDGLTRLNGRLALAGAAVPAGRYARTWLERRGVLATLEPNIVSADSVRAALALVESGTAAAAVVYATDARIAKRARVLFAVPDADDPGIVYVAAAVRGGQPAAAAAYLRWLRTPAFVDLARERGFRPPQ